MTRLETVVIGNTITPKTTARPKADLNDPNRQPVVNPVDLIVAIE